MYRVAPQSMIEIVRILHDSMDLNARLHFPTTKTNAAQRLRLIRLRDPSPRRHDWSYAERRETAGGVSGLCRSHERPDISDR
jgi:hypothetical protein